MLNHSTAFKYILIGTGLLGVVYSLCYDYIRPGVPKFGPSQFMGFIASVMILLVGLRKLSVSKKAFWDFISFFIYIAGLLYLVLMPHGHAHHGNKVFLGFAGFPKRDFILNVFGFLPLGYFLISMHSDLNRKIKHTFTFCLVLALGLSVSLTIESIQYFIPGRTSSLVDVAANGFGTLLGMFCYLLDKLISERSSKTPKVFCN